ncbi:hypothetical protein QWY77_00045 [Thalassotalea ponticola]|uniref:hypothetical protein n=1 Tax=Thalassotalea ponticola TaxID=1523392 RepID=UPI0025B3F7EB|nr:hypothetical protein [Thalassotalea ponticola]MDN3651177.1 hypothetical protein [Thalassotalea ponticola]
MKKLALTGLTLMSLFGTATTHATELGLGIDQGFGVSAKINNFQLFAGDDGISLDYFFATGKLAQQHGLSWYFAGGAFVAEHDFGIRAPLGVTLSFAPRWHLYGQLSPQLEKHDDDHHGHDDGIQFGLDAAIGVRYRF